MSSVLTGAWKKSTRCDAGNCVEVKINDGVVAVRDNTDPQTSLAFDRESWAALLGRLSADRHVG